ncbi:MAG: splicing factor family protein [Bacteroidales bacterium]|jgi:hypothetical protein|nr:splicing factor family protein [Bacteroidales bacterium]
MKKKMLFFVLSCVLAAGLSVWTANEAFCVAAYSGVKPTDAFASIFDIPEPAHRALAMDMDDRAKADIGNILYVIIILFALFGGIIEKALKKKRQEAMKQQQRMESDAEKEENELLSRMPENVVGEEEEMIENWRKIREKWAIVEKTQEGIDETETETAAPPRETPKIVPAEPEYMQKEEKYIFDIRQAIIANEILNRKYR